MRRKSPGERLGRQNVLEVLTWLSREQHSVQALQELHQLMSAVEKVLTRREQ
jgi:hypothetical protein